MSELKRNQIEEAISWVLEEQAPTPSTVVRTRVKRLLGVDRELGRRANDPERASYAFHSVEPPGSGVEVWFSAYEAFALLVGLILMGHNWPQSYVVSVLRHARRRMEREHSRVLKLDPKQLFNEGAIREKARPGAMVFSNTDPILLTIASPGSSSEEQALETSVMVGAPKEAFTFARNASGGRAPYTMMEITSLAHKFSNALAKTRPRRRGRGR